MAFKKVGEVEKLFAALAELPKYPRKELEQKMGILPDSLSYFGNEVVQALEQTVIPDLSECIVRRADLETILSYLEKSLGKVPASHHMLFARERLKAIVMTR